MAEADDRASAPPGVALVRGRPYDSVTFVVDDARELIIMPICTAEELSWSPPPRCPVCNVGITTNGRRQPVAVDENGRAHCRTHGHLVAPEYDDLLVNYERMRQAQADVLRLATDDGVTPTHDEVEKIRHEWDAAA